MIKFIVKLCQSKAAFDVVVDRRSIPLILERFEKGNFDLVTDTPFIKIFRHQEIEISVFDSGKLMVKGISERGEVENFIEKLFGWGKK
ncbi:MAG: hypothetical protein ACE5K0_11725 [Candidatus Methanofastidiosia archaeon]